MQPIAKATDKELDELRAAHGMLRSVMDHRPFVADPAIASENSVHLTRGQGRIRT